MLSSFFLYKGPLKFLSKQLQRLTNSLFAWMSQSVGTSHLPIVSCHPSIETGVALQSARNN